MILDKTITKDEGFEGTLKNFRLTDLIQMCCMAGATTAIRVTQDSHQGTIIIKDGDIVQAICNETMGEEAFYQIISWKRGSFETMSVHPIHERMIDKNWEFLLLEGARMGDEQAITDNGPAKTEGKVPTSPLEDKVRVLIVDDSPLMCRILQELLTADEEITVIGVAHNGEEALKKIDELKPNLITLDVNMPVMDGGTALKHIMIKNPCPIVIISKLGSKSPGNILDFLRLGAVDFIYKPKKSEDMDHQQRQLVETIKLAAKVKVGNFKRMRVPKIRPKGKPSLGDRNPIETLVVISSGMGGYAELMKVVSLLAGNLNACLIGLQSMPSDFLIPFSEYLDTLSELCILPIQHKVPLLSGRCYIGAPDSSLKIDLGDSQYFFELEDDLSRLQEIPNPFDRFLYSIANSLQARILVVLLSGAEVGHLKGLHQIKQKNGRIIIQQLNSCMAFRPLQRTVEAQLVDFEGTHDEIAREIIKYSMNPSSEDPNLVQGMRDE
jgi:two-component system chemotaxis response regulator CheB